MVTLLQREIKNSVIPVYIFFKKLWFSKIQEIFYGTSYSKMKKFVLIVDKRDWREKF
jgi:hypothetical protein